jgi:hypothetical protein
MKGMSFLGLEVQNVVSPDSYKISIKEPSYNHSDNQINDVGLETPVYQTGNLLVDCAGNSIEIFPREK